MWLGFAIENALQERSDFGPLYTIEQLLDPEYRIGPRQEAGLSELAAANPEIVGRFKERKP